MSGFLCVCKARKGLWPSAETGLKSQETDAWTVAQIDSGENSIHRLIGIVPVARFVTVLSQNLSSRFIASVGNVSVLHNGTILLTVGQKLAFRAASLRMRITSTAPSTRLVGSATGLILKCIGIPGLSSTRISASCSQR